MSIDLKLVSDKDKVHWELRMKDAGVIISNLTPYEISELKKKFKDELRIHFKEKYKL